MGKDELALAVLAIIFAMYILYTVFQIIIKTLEWKAWGQQYYVMDSYSQIFLGPYDNIQTAYSYSKEVGKDAHVYKRVRHPNGSTEFVKLQPGTGYGNGESPRTG